MPANTATKQATTLSGRKLARALRPRDDNRRAGAAAAAARSAPDPEVIVLSSDTEDDDYAPQAKLPAKRKKKSTRDENAKNANAGAGSSSKGQAGASRAGSALDVTMAGPRAESSTDAQLRGENERLKQELAAEKRTKAALQTELAESKAKNAKGKTVDLVSDLEDCTVCEICTLRMWSPATLVECGHTFCQSCLRDWFDTTLSQHIQQHPHYLTEPQIPVQLLQLQDRARLQAVQAYLADHRRRLPQPAYTCPACRGPVKAKPVEMFAFKEVVHKVAQAAGENVPNAPAQNRAAGANVGGVWDGFFKN